MFPDEKIYEGKAIRWIGMTNPSAIIATTNPSDDH